MIDILIDPLVWMTIGLVSAILLALTLRRCARCAVMLSALLALLVIVASPVLANRWLGTLEDQYPSAACTAEAQSKVTVALGGGFLGGYSNLGLAQRLTDASKNRALAAAAIVPSEGMLVLSGGSLRPAEQPNEADAMAELVRPFLADSVQLLTETESTDTSSNAAYVAALFEQRQLERDIVLVSSASHLPRAAAIFKKHGFKVCAHGVDPQQATLDAWTAYLPRVSAIQKTSLAIHEWTGIYYYRHLGWI